MIAFRRLVPLAGLFGLSTIFLLAAPPGKDQIAQWVKQLGDNDFDVREEASRKLWEAGEVAEDAIRAAAKSEDAEVSRRAGEVLEKFKWGIFPDTPKSIVDLVQRYQGAQGNAHGEIIRQLLDGGVPGCKVLVKIAKVETNPDVRANLMTQLTNELPRAVPSLLDENNIGVLQRFVEIGLENQVHTGITHYTAFWLLRGKLDERIAHFQALEKKGDDPKKQAEILAYLHRARGDLKAAIDAAQRAGIENLVDHLLVEAGDWKQLAERNAAAEQGDEIEKLSYRAAYFRLAGEKKEMLDVLAQLRKIAEGVPPGDDKPQQVAKALFLNGRPDEALEILGKGDDALMVFEVLCARNQFKEAFELVDKARFNNKPELPTLELAEARVLHLLGEKDKAAPIFAKYAGLIKENNEVSWYENLVDAEVRVGLTDAAFEHAAKVIAVSKDAQWLRRFFDKLYPGKTQIATDVWGALRQTSPNETIPATMKRLRALLDGKAPAKEVQDFLDAADKMASGTNVGLLTTSSLMAQGGEVARAAKMNDRAIVLFEKAGRADGWLRAGDVYADNKRWDKAAEDYAKAWSFDRGNPLPLWLSGWALKHAGKDAEAKKRMEQAHWIPLGSEAVRNTFALDLAKRRHFEASRQESALLLKLSEPGSFYSGEAQRRVALAALGRRDYAAAVAGHDKAMLRVLRSYIKFVQSQAYVAVPSSIAKMRAAALMKAGHPKEALAAARLSLDILPGNIDLAILLMPDLEKKGLKKEADDLFEQALRTQEKLCRDYPNCAFAHNQLAWLRVCCRHDLDKALAHALLATKLAPDNPGDHDTLAEVYFQRGDQAKAVEIQKKVVAMAPTRLYFRKQLKRIEAGDPKVERPVEDDDEDDD